MSFKKYISQFVLVVILVALSTFIGTMSVSGYDAPDQQDSVEIFTRDVYVIVGSTLRNPDSTTPSDAPLFNTAGVNLGVTWGAWQAASAQSTLHTEGGPNHPRQDIRIHLTGLIPGGVYSIFYVTLTPDSNNPLCPGAERGLALTAFKPESQSPDPSSFVADGSGQADFRGLVDGDLMSAYQLAYEVIYHSDGHTYHPLPNHGEFNTQGAGCRSSFGEDAMRQLVIWQKFS